MRRSSSAIGVTQRLVSVFFQFLHQGRRALLVVGALVLVAAPAGAEVLRRVPMPYSVGIGIVSGNGRFVVGGQWNSWPLIRCGIYVHDLQTSGTECVSVTDLGRLMDLAAGPSISADGDLVAFVGSTIENGPCYRHTHIYVRNRRTQHTECLSITEAGVPGNNQSHAVFISAAGNVVVFGSYASNLVSGDADTTYDLFAVRLVNGHRSGPIVRLTGPTGNPVLAEEGNNTWLAAVNADGRFVVFQSSRSDVVPNDTNGASDVFRRDLTTGETVRVSVSTSGAQANGHSATPAVSADGRFVSFSSHATNLIDGGAVRPRQIYRRDLLTGETVMVSRGQSGGGSAGVGTDTSISADGQVIVFRSAAPDLVPFDTNQLDDVFAADLRTGTARISRLSVALNGVTQRDGFSDMFEFSLSISADARVVVFPSSATNLAPGDGGNGPFIARAPTRFPGLLTGAAGGGGPHVRAIGLGGLGMREFFAFDPRFAGGVTVAYGDVSGDGIADLVSAAGPGGGPHVRIFDGARYTPDAFGGAGSFELAGFFAYEPGFTGGVWIAVGDVTGDGVAEIITGAGAGGGPHVRVFQVRSSGSRVTVSEYASFFAYAPRFTGGVRVATGDLDGDGAAEILTAAGSGGGPHVQGFKLGSAAEPIQVLSFFAYDARFSGGVFVAAGDVDGDGKDEIVTGADAGAGPHVRVLTVGAGFSFLRDAYGFFAYDPAFTGGVRVAAGDLDGDGVAEIITAPGPGAAPLVRTFARAAGGLIELSSFFAYDPAFRGGVFVAAPH